jgi:hypothetical protein
LLDLSSKNVAALQVRALALSGLAVTADVPADAAVEAFAHLRAVANAPGLAAETRRLLEVIASQDDAGVLADINP